MAEGIVATSGASVGVSLTGVAGPGEPWQVLSLESPISVGTRLRTTDHGAVGVQHRLGLLDVARGRGVRSWFARQMDARRRRKGRPR